jgi:hypothetical protein
VATTFGGMRHATPAALETLAPLLVQLRLIDGIKETRHGAFSRRSRAFLHFHEDPTGMYADVRLDEAADFERLRVTTAAEQARLLRAVRKAVRA